ncbi:hypothetical protein ACTS91_02930 [Empedobacter falsenii]|jgi:uncharacterized MnhB-related membrane protein|uniref:Uncharacterized protein n=1 Tax=Empedobacter tilapiae TaxID=2491114 RepID=A0A4Z1BY89_9FLAO|nr:MULTISPECIES: hypothetical protein [Empedobacter]HAD78982.1 hypothetical protein [Flavobacteriaceae bacterium]MDH0659818.1 hypothetical protein [Empedobacter sp. GD03865]MDH1883628.1 hypothetical protein [Empedobacter sp. GD03797]MDM1041105.1 hypothetical protein [Empedobacter brevis]MDM1134831.1 hypothetical protein [Empedobacter sp. R750]
MKQNIIYSIIFFFVLFGLKYLFDKSDVQTMLVYSAIGTVIFFIYRVVVRKMLYKQKDQEN